MEQSPLFFSGISGLVVPLRQKEFPPEFAGASRLTYYASLFNSIEINSSFYKLPRAVTVEKWRAMVPDDFRFTYKISKVLTHAKGLQFNGADVTAFAETVAAAGEKKGCLLMQFPASIKRDREEEVHALLENIYEEAPGWRIAVEFRDRSWYQRAVYRMLQQYGATMVEHDMTGSEITDLAVSDKFSYIRFHGPEPGYRGDYSEATLARYAERIANIVKNGSEVYVYFNNTLGAALLNLQRLNELTSQRL